MKIMIMFVDLRIVDGLIQAVQDHGAVTQFEKGVIAVLEFFRFHHFSIAPDATFLTMLGPNTPATIPPGWRNFITTIPTHQFEGCTFFIQAKNQVFQIKISRYDADVNINVRVNFFDDMIKQCNQTIVQEKNNRKNVFISAYFQWEVLSTSHLPGAFIR